jgi:hypothetical protein
MKLYHRPFLFAIALTVTNMPNLFLAGFGKKVIGCKY